MQPDNDERLLREVLGTFFPDGQHWLPVERICRLLPPDVRCNSRELIRRLRRLGLDPEKAGYRRDDVYDVLKDLVRTS